MAIHAAPAFAAASADVAVVSATAVVAAAATARTNRALPRSLLLLLAQCVLMAQLRSAPVSLFRHVTGIDAFKTSSCSENKGSNDRFKV